MAVRPENVTAPMGAVAPLLPGSQAPGRSSVLAALAYRDYRYIWACSVAWQLGNWVLQIAQGWLVFELTHSPLMLGIVGFASGAPMLLLAPLGGAIADRMDRKKVLTFVQTGHVLLGLTQAVLATGGWIQVWQIILIALTSGTLSCITMPARQTLVISVVGRKHLSDAIALNSIGQNSIRILGPATGGLLIGALGVNGAFFFSAGFVALSVACIVMMRPPPKAEAVRRDRLLESMTQGIRYGWQDRNIRTLLIVATVSTFFGLSYTQLMPAFAKEILGLGPAGYGLLMSSAGLGALAGSLYMVWTSNAQRKGRVLMLAQLTLGVALALFALSRFIPLSFVFLMSVGAGSAVWMALTNTLLQTYCAPEYQGRVMSLYLITFGLQNMGGLASGALASAIGVPWAFGSSGAVVVALSLYMILVSRRVWRL